MGCNPWEPKTPAALIEHKLGIKNVFENAAMRRGTHLEPQARLAYEQLTGNIVEPVVGVHDDLPIYSASLDGITFDGDVIAEIKCPFKGEDSNAYKKASKGDAGHYIWQIQHQLFVSGAKLCHFYVYDGDRGVLLEIERDDDKIKQLIAAWESFGKAMAEAERTDEAWIEAATRYKVAKMQYDAAKADFDAAEKQLTGLAIGNKTIGHGVIVSRSKRKGSVDYGAIPELSGIDLDNYRKPDSSVTRITLAGE